MARRRTSPAEDLMDVVRPEDLWQIRVGQNRPDHSGKQKTAEEKDGPRGESGG